MKEIYIRKLRYEEAKIKLEREIHSAFMEGETFVEVIHGIGEGKLKQLTIEFAQSTDFLKIYDPGDFVQTNPGSTKLEILSPTKNYLKKIKK